VESLGDVVKVMGVQTSDGDSAISCHVDMVFVLKGVNLVGRETSVSKHTNLAGDVAPVVLATMSGQFFNKS